MIASHTSQGVTISVETFFQPDYSNVLKSEYVFAYKINILNTNSFAIQLLRRHWYVVDSDGSKKEVEGEGVIGQQPIIEPDANYQYISGTNFTTDMGKMFGTYTMQNLYTQENFEVTIPEFVMIAPFKHN
jgi:ApaG protein